MEIVWLSMMENIMSIRYNGSHMHIFALTMEFKIRPYEFIYCSQMCQKTHTSKVQPYSKTTYLSINKYKYKYRHRRMDFNHTSSHFTYAYDTNIHVWVWHEWEVWFELCFYYNPCMLAA